VGQSSPEDAPAFVKKKESMHIKYITIEIYAVYILIFSFIGAHFNGLWPVKEG
jgi:hypothetical protein